MSATHQEILFGRIAVHNGLVTQQQLDEVLAEREADPSLDLGQLMLERGFLSEKQYRAILSASESHMKKKAEKVGGASAGGDSSSAVAAVAEATPPAAPAARKAKGAPAPPPETDKPLPPPPPLEPKKGERDAEAEARKERIRTTAERFAAEAEGGGMMDVPPRPATGQAHKQMLEFLTLAREQGASDLHLPCQARPFLRRHGQMLPLNHPVLTDPENEKLIASILTDEQWARYYKHLDLDICIDLGASGRFRTNVLHQRHGISAVFRVVKEHVPTLEALGLPEVLERLTTFHQGLVLVTGPAGSGKSSTLAALLEIVNRTRKENIITLEDPIEFIYEPKKCNIIQRQIELHTQSWANALRAALRENPDVIMVGEMRDLETVSLAITSAETGHLVFGTLHTTNATRTIDRVLDVFPPKEQAQIRAMVSESLKGVVSQQLVPTVDGKKRVAAVEVMFSTPAVANLIREKQTYKLFSVLQTGKKLGMRLMDDSLMELLDKGLITKDEAKARAANPKLFAAK